MTGPTLASHVERWRPDPVEVTEVLDRAPSRALAGLFDVASPVEGSDAALPPGWHWLHFLDRPAQAELGADGHPTDGHFLPPIPGRRRMFAGGRVTWHAPLPFGVEVTRRSEVAEVRPTSGRSGELVFVTLRHHLSVGGAVAVVEEQDLVYRQAPPSSGPAPAAAAAATPSAASPSAATPSAATPSAASPPAATPPDGHEPTAPWSASLATDPTVLFRFSALTYNGHRIHYDRPYATEVEGFGGLVVHGPLLALLALELPRRSTPTRPVRHVEYRLRRPAFGGPPVIATGDPATGEVAVGGAGGAPSLTATVQLT